MKSALGRDPTPQELYLGWQQGAGGASSLLKGADKPVGQLTTIGNVTANPATGAVGTIRLVLEYTNYTNT